MRCINCGAENDEFNRFCSTCGASLEGCTTSTGTGQTWEAVPPEPTPSDMAQHAGRPRLSPAIAAVISLGVAIIIVAVIMIAWPKASVTPDLTPGTQAVATLTPEIAKKQHAVSFDIGSAKGTAPSTIECADGETVTLPDCTVTYEGHTFAGWKIPNGSVSKPGSSIPVTASMRLSAVWDTTTCTMRFSGDGADAGSTADVTTSYGSAITLPACGFTRPGFEFECWVAEDGLTYHPGDSLTIRSDSLMTARWKAIPQQQTPPPASTPQAPPARSAGYVLQDSDTHLYSTDELERFSNWELYLARNEIFARHGRGFKNQDLRDHFASCSWYTERYDPDYFDANLDSTLSEVEHANALTIRDLESSRNSPYL